jgi:nucleoside-diphosphate-sugar epimerase
VTLPSAFQGLRVLLVAGAGFVGSNLVGKLLTAEPTEVPIVDNLLSADRVTLPNHPAVRFIEGSIADDAVLATLRGALDCVFHLAYAGWKRLWRGPGYAARRAIDVYGNRHAAEEIADTLVREA